MKSFYLICLLSLAFCADFLEEKKEESNYIVFNKNEWVSRMQWLAQQKSKYKNQWPWNVLYYDGSVWWCDCKIIILIPLIYSNLLSFLLYYFLGSNLQKALFNGRDIYHATAGSYQRDLTNTGDVTVEVLYQKCTDRSSDFSKLKAGEPRILWMSGHIVSLPFFIIFLGCLYWKGSFHRSWNMQCC